MTLGDRILVPLDGSPFAEAAVPLAASVARRRDGSLVFIAVHSPLPVVERGGLPDLESTWERAARRELEEYLADARQRAAREAGVPVEAALLAGQAPEQIVAAVGDRNCDLIVQAAHGRGGVARAWLGSVTDRVLRHTHVPVLVVRPGEDPSRDLAGDHSFERVIVPLDGSPLAESALTPALSLATTFGAACTLYRVVRPTPLADANFHSASWAMDADLVEQRKAGAEQYLQDLCDRVRNGGVPCDGLAAVGVSVAESILELARAHPSSLLALSTHGRGGFRRLLMGSVADKVVRGADRPVLVVPPPRGKGD